MPIPRSLFCHDEPTDHDLWVSSGTWPAGLSGELVLTGPHPSTFGGPHPLFGDGITYRLSLQPGTHGAAANRFAWRQRAVDSPSARLRTLRPDVFTATMIGVRSPFGHSNAANTALVPWGDRLFATWDVGRPTEIDPLGLHFLGEVGHRDQWQAFEAMGPQPVLPLVMTTAHPVIDPDRNVMWTVNTMWGQLHLVRIDADGSMRCWPIEGATIPQSVHTVTQTRNWLVVADCAFKFEPQVLNGGDRTEPANDSGPVYLIAKDDLEAAPAGTPVRCRTLTIAPEVNHYYAHYDDTDAITVVFEHTQNADLAMTQSPADTDALGRRCDPALAGLYGFPMSPDRTSVVVVDPATATVVHRAEQRIPELLWTRQLNALDWSTQGRSAPTLHHTVHQGWRPEAVTEKMLALYGDRVDRSLLASAPTAPVVASTSPDDLVLRGHWVLADDDLPTSPVFVPRDPGAGGSAHAGSQPGGHDGWVVVPVLNDDGFRVEVFDAADVSAGPVATLSAGTVTVPFVLHSAWMPQVVTAPDAQRVRFADELARINELDDDLADAARQVADDLDHGVPMATPAASRDR